MPGSCVDIGALRSVIGLKEARKMFDRIGMRLQPQPPAKTFRFADSVYKSFSTVMIRLESLLRIPTIKVTLEVISGDIPALFGMEVIDANSLTPCTVSDRVIKRSIVDHKNTSQFYVMDYWSVSLKRHEGRLYAEMSLPVLTFYSKANPLRLQRHFFHSSSKRL